MLLERLIEAPERRITVTRNDSTDLQSYADPLGLTSTQEGVANLLDRPLSDLDQQRQQNGLELPTVADMRGYSDPDGFRGLTPDLQDLLVWSYAMWSGRSLRQGGRDVQLTRLGHLPEDAELVRPELPGEEEWQQALARAAWAVGQSSIGPRAARASTTRHVVTTRLG